MVAGYDCEAGFFSSLSFSMLEYWRLVLLHVVSLVLLWSKCIPWLRSSSVLHTCTRDISHRHRQRRQVSKSLSI